MSPKSVGLEQARANLPSLAAQAHAGKASIITKHGKPYAAVVPVAQAQGSRRRPRLLDLRGTGAGLWSASELGSLRDEWD